MSAPNLILPWQPWPGRGWPASLTQERAFVLELEAAARAIPPDPNEPVRRAHFTAVLTALRCGATVADIHAVAPAISAHLMRDAYRVLDERLQVSRAVVAELGELVHTADDKELTTAIADRYELISRVLPAPAERLLEASAARVSAVRPILEDVLARMADIGARAEQVEAELYGHRRPRRDPRGIELGKALYNPYDESLYTHPYYLPTRVAALDSPRARVFLADKAIDPDLDEASDAESPPQPETE